MIAAAATFAQSSQRVTDVAGDPLAAIPEANQLLLPLPRFAEAAAVGIVNVATDQTGTPRFIPLISRSADRLDPAFPLRVASVALGVDPTIEPDAIMLGKLRIPTDIGQRLPVTFMAGMAASPPSAPPMRWMASFRRMRSLVASSLSVRR